MTSLPLLLATLAILPTQARDQTRNVIKVRGGPNQPADVRASQADASHYAGRARLAVLPFSDSGADPTLIPLRTGAMDSVLADLRYVPAYLVADRSEVIDVLAGRPTPSFDDPKELPELARRLGVTLLVVGRVATEGPKLEIGLKLYQVDGAGPRLVAESKSAAPRDAIYTAEADALLALLEQARTVPAADRVAEMKKVPTRSFLARSLVDAGLARLDALPGKERAADEVVEASKAALADAAAALKADRNSLPALMLRATCLFNLGDDQLKECLERCRAKASPEKVDALTALELEGDYLTFHDARFAEAAAAYRKMLDYDPANLRALWTLTGLYSGDYKALELARLPDSSKLAADYASRIVLAHPRSAAAVAFLPKPDRP